MNWVVLIAVHVSAASTAVVMHTLVGYDKDTCLTGYLFGACFGVTCLAIKMIITG